MPRPGRIDGDTLVGNLTNLARFSPRTTLTYPNSGERISATELRDASRGFAHELRAHGVRPGDVVGIVDVTAPSFLVSFFGTVMAGAAASPLPIPAVFSDPSALVRRIARIIRSAGMRTVVLSPAMDAVAEGLRSVSPHVTLLAPAAGRTGGALPDPSPADLAVVQFTSGSTGSPKGVALSHEAVTSGLRASVISGQLSPDDVYVQWVPHYHDMGLIGMLTNFLNGADVHLFTPTSFLRSPRAFLSYMAERGGTVTAAPDFSYDLLVKAVDGGRVNGLDLSRWRLAFNGSEPIRPAGVRRFSRTLAAAGVRPSVMFPVYGMAEATLAVCFPEPGSVPRIVSVDRDALSTRGTVRMADGQSAPGKDVVSVGKPVHGLGLRVVSDGEVLTGDGRIGEIQICGPSVTSGYYRDGDTTAERFDGPWLRTGDLGFRLGEDVFVVGRTKEMIVVRGRNFFPEDVEAEVREVEGVHRGHCVAFGETDASDAEYMSIVVEVARHRTDLEALRDAVARRVSLELDLDRVRVHVVPPRWLTKTTSGKWQRSWARERLRESHGE